MQVENFFYLFKFNLKKVILTEDPSEETYFKMARSNHDFLFKILILGDSSVGKVQIKIVS